MLSDYQQQIKEIFGTSDLDELRELAKMLKTNHPNPRNAGRKAQLTPDQTVEVLELHRKGIGNTEIAKQLIRQRYGKLKTIMTVVLLKAQMSIRLRKARRQSLTLMQSLVILTDFMRLQRTLSTTMRPALPKELPLQEKQCLSAPIAR